VGACGAIALAFVRGIVSQKSERDIAPIAQGESPKPWFDERLQAFFTAKAAQARQLAGGELVAPEVWPYFEAGMRGD